MKMIKMAAASAVMCVAGGVASAQTYSCAISDSRNSGWLPETLVFQISSDETMAKTFDPITFSTLNGFADANVQVENSVRVVLHWKTGRYRNDREMETRDTPNAVPKEISYRATLLRGGNKILLNAQPAGGKRFSGRGACTLRNGDIASVAQR